jgi:sugar phosphate isomerase/epimerase
MLNRRDFLATAGAALATSVCGRAAVAESAAFARRERLQRIGIQLYAVRREMQRDADGTLRRLAEIGYREVEYAGYHGRTPAETRAMLDRHGLTAPSTHVGYDQIAGGWDRALDDALARGHRIVTIPWLPADVRRSAATWRAVADVFNHAADAARARGLTFAYHNHDFEFVPVEGVVPFDLLLAHTDPAIVAFQMDLFWLVKAGADPIAYLRAHPRRFTMLHIKDSGGAPAHAQVDVGAGTIDFAAILRKDADQRGTIRHVFVEHDQPADAMAFAKASYDYLRRLEY